MKIVLNPIQMGATSIVMAVCSSSLPMYFICCLLIGFGLGLIGCKRELGGTSHIGPGR